MSTQIQVLPKSGLTIGTTPITLGVAGRVLFEGAGNVVQEDAGFLFDSVNKSLTNYGKGGITSNTSFGLNASQSNTIGANNVSIGFESLKNNLTGGFTTAIGYTALRDMTGIGYSTAIGWGAGIGITSGHTNTLLGYGAGGGITTGNNNTIIGVNIASLAAGTLNNVILADGGGNIAIKKDANHFVGIGYSATATLGAKLDVKAQGALSTDIAFRVRNSADTYNILSCYGTELTIIGRNESTEPRLLINRTGGTRMLLGGTTDLSISFPSSGKGEINSGTQGLDIISTSGDIRTRNSSTSTILQGNYFGIGQATPQARLDIKAQGALSTDIAFRVRNSADTFNLLSIDGVGLISGRTDGAGGFSMNYQGIANTTVQLGFQNTNPYLRVANSNAGGNAFNVYTSSDNREYLAGLIGKATLAIGANPFGGTIKPNEANTNTLYMFNGTAPALSATDSFNLYSADIVAGNAAPHFRTENGSVIKLYKQDLPTNPTNAELATFLSNLGLANLI